MTKTQIAFTTGRRSRSWPGAVPVRVHHVGRRAIYLRGADGALLTVTDAGVGLAPRGVEVGTPAEFARTARAARDARAGTVVLDAHATAEADLTLLPGPVSDAALAALAGRLASRSASLRPEHAALHGLGARLARELAAGIDPTQAALALIGAGPGATPAGDDVVIGVFAAQTLAGRADLAAALASAVLPLLPRTTALSATWLRAAAAGEFASFVHALAAALADPARVPDACAKALAVGASSGLDTALALVAATHLSQRKEAA